VGVWFILISERVRHAASKGCGAAGRQQRVRLDLRDCELQVVAWCAWNERAGLNGNARKHQRMRARNWRATGTGARKSGWKLVRKHQRARALNGRAGVNGIARRQQRVRSWSGLVSINGRARQRLCAWSLRASINGRARGARERGLESRSPISKFKPSLKSSVVAPGAVVVGVRDAPYTKGRSSKANYNSNVLCCNSLSNAG
jgi:hypothetical protein